jgi:hypothetical protein
MHGKGIKFWGWVLLFESKYLVDVCGRFDMFLKGDYSFRCEMLCIWIF